MKSKKIILLTALCLSLLLGLYGCRNSPVLQQIIYNQDSKDVDYDNDYKVSNNDEDNTDGDDNLSSLKEGGDKNDTRKTGAVSGDKDSEASASDIRYNMGGSENFSTGTTNGQSDTASSGGAQNNGSSGGGLSGGEQDEPPVIDPPEPIFHQILDPMGNLVDLPENVDSVVAVGNASAMVEMLGGTLVASSADFLENNFTATVFDNVKNGTVQRLWDGDGSTAITPDNFNRLLALAPDVCIIISGQGSFTQEQKEILYANKIAVYTLPKLITTSSIKEAVSAMGTDLFKDKLLKDGATGQQKAAAYTQWFDQTVNDLRGRGDRFCYVDFYGKAYDYDMDPDTASIKYMENYHAGTTGKYTMFISDWDDTAYCAILDNNKNVVTNGLGAAIAQSGIYSPLHYYMSMAGVLNNTMYNSQSSDTAFYYVGIQYGSLGERIIGSKANYRVAGDYYPMTVNSAPDALGAPRLGNDVYPAIIVASQDIKAKLSQNLLWQNYQSNSDGTHGTYEIYVNPSGVGDWTQASVESILESIWVANKFHGVYTDQEVRDYISQFYSTFYGYTLTPDDLNKILAGKAN